MTDTTSTTGADAELVALIRAQADLTTIAAIGIRHAAAIDQRDWPRLRSCYTSDASAYFEGIGQLDTVADIERACRSAIEPLSASQHLVTNAEVVVDSDRAGADVRSSFHAQHVRPGTAGGDQFVVAGTYTDRVVLTADGWRISHRDLAVVWTTGNPAVLGP